MCLRISPWSDDEIASVNNCPRSGWNRRRNYRNAYAPPRTGRLRALLRRDDGEGGPALFYFVAAAVRAGDLCLLMRSNGQNLRKHFLAHMAEELVVGHRDLSAEGVTGGILDLWISRCNMGSGHEFCVVGRGLLCSVFGRKSRWRVNFCLVIKRG